MRKSNNPLSLARSQFTVYAFGRTTFIEIAVYKIKPPGVIHAATDYLQIERTRGTLFMQILQGIPVIEKIIIMI